MTAKFHNDIRFYTLKVNESVEMAEKSAIEFEKKFNNLDKYDQMVLSQTIEIDGWEAGFEQIDKM